MVARFDFGGRLLSQTYPPTTTRRTRETSLPFVEMSGLSSEALALGWCADCRGTSLLVSDWMVLMSESATEAKLRELSRQLKNEKTEHARTRNELQREITRVWRLVPSHYITLMGVYPPLRKLLHVLAEAADLQDPSRGAPIEDTMRTEYIANGENASTSSTERGVLTHQRARQNVRLFGKELEHLRERFSTELEDRAHRFAQTIGATEWEYELPDNPVCWVHGCPKRGVKQPYLAWSRGCGGCGRMFEMERTGT